MRCGAVQTVLWAIFTFYVPHTQKLLIPSSSSKSPKNSTKSKIRNHSKRILSLQALWTLLHDFGICPMLCSRTRLSNLAAALLTPPSQQAGPQGAKLPAVLSPAPGPGPGPAPGPAPASSSKMSHSEAVLSFHSFHKVGCWCNVRANMATPCR